MPQGLNSAREFDVARIAARKLRRTIRELRELLMTEANPINFCSILGELAIVEVHLDQCSMKVGEEDALYLFPRERTRSARSRLTVDKSA